MRQQRGFTLVEMLLAITLMSLLLALAYGGLRASMRASESGQDLLEQTGSLRITHQFIRRQINQILPLAFLTDDSNEGSIAYFVGHSQFIQYVAPMPGYLGSGGPQVQLLEVAQGENGLQLQFSHALFEGFLPELLFERPPVVLLDNIADARFEFLALDDTGQAYEWLSEWEDMNAVPMAIRLLADLGADSRVAFPELTAAVKIDPMALSGAGGAADYQSAIQELIQGNREGNREN